MTVPESMLPDLFALERRLSQKIQSGRGIQLSSRDLDLLCLTGAVEFLAVKAAQELQQQVRRRYGITEPEDGPA